MTSITVQRTGFGIVVAESDDAEATTVLDGLPPLRAARYLTATPALRDALRSASAEVVDAVLPHLDGEVVVPEAGLARPGDDGEAESTRLAQALGVSVVAPEGRIVRCAGTLFSVGGGDGWIAQSPVGARVRAGRRYPAPAWQSHLPESLRGTAHIPAGLWVTAGSAPRHAVRLASIAVREQQLLLVVGSPTEPAPTEERLLAVLRALPVETRSAIVLAGYGPESLPIGTVRSLAAALDQPLRIAHGVEVDGAPVRLDGDEDVQPTTLALESICTPDGTVTLERWAPPPGLVAANAVEYRLGETPTTRRRVADRWLVHVVAAGLVVRPAGQPLVDAADLEAPTDSLGIFVQCDGAQQPAALPALLDPLRVRLEQRSAVTIHPLDAAARLVVRDAYPGAWAPTETLAITADGRIVAAAADASGDTTVGDEALADATATEVAGAAVAIDTDEVGTATMTAEARDAEPAPGAEVAEEQVAAVTLDAEPVPQLRTRAQRRVVAEATASRDAPMARTASVTVEAVIGGGDAAPTPAESAGAAERRARDAQITNAPSADAAAAAWYAAAVHRPAPSDAAVEAPAPTEAPAPRGAAPASAPEPSATPAPEPTVSRAAEPPTAPVPDRVATQESASAAGAVAAATAPAAPRRASEDVASDALSRALQGSAATRLLGGASPAPRPTSAPDVVQREAAAPVAATHADEAAADAPPQSAPLAEAPPAPVPAPRRSAPAIEVPADARSTAEQRHRVRMALGSRYDVASRTVAQLLAQQPGMRVASDRSAMLTGLSLVRVFATEPHAEHDLDFHTCLAEGLAMLPTARSVVVRGIPASVDAAPGTLLRLRTPLVAAPADGPATGPAEALIWTTSGRRLDRVLHGAPGAADVVLPAGVRLRVLGTAEGPSSRLLLAEEGADAEQALARLQAAEEARGEVGAHVEDRWFGDLPLAA